MIIHSMEARLSMFRVLEDNDKKLYYNSSVNHITNFKHFPSITDFQLNKPRKRILIKSMMRVIIIMMTP